VSVGEWMTTIGAELERPPKLRWINVRASTDWEPFACQPAPDNAVSTFGANTANTTATTTQAIATARTWSAAKRPSRPIGPTAAGCSTGTGRTTGTSASDTYDSSRRTTHDESHHTQLYNYTVLC